LDIVFEENDHHHQLRQQHRLLLQQQQQQQQQQNNIGYQPSPSLNFLRPKPTYSTPYASTDASTTNNGALPPVRRARAGTMPSFIHPEMTNNNRPSNNSSAALLLTTIEAGRHRSGSLNLPPPVDGSFWSIRHDAPLSPSSEQLLQNDSDFSIARTMRSLGLEEDDDEQEKQTPPPPPQAENEPLINSLFHHQSPPEFHMPSRSLLSGNNRNRSYSVNATARYEDNNNSNRLSRASSLNNKLSFASPLEGFARQQQSRPRSSSMGRADAGKMGMLPPLMGFWNTANGNGNQRGSPLVSMREEDYETSSNTSSNQQQSLSLGDSELLANILGKEEDQEDMIVPDIMMMEVKISYIA
jgi:hypothetical protein